MQISKWFALRLRSGAGSGGRDLQQRSRQRSKKKIASKMNADRLITSKVDAVLSLSDCVAGLLICVFAVVAGAIAVVVIVFSGHAFRVSSAPNTKPLLLFPRQGF